jgi:hypothetical protein
MSSICFEPEGSSSERRLYIQVWYSVFPCISMSSLLGSVPIGLPVFNTFRMYPFVQ